MASNRRTFERFGSDMIFWIRPINGDEKDFEPFEIENISGGGILCRTSHPFTLGEDVILSFELPQHTDLIEARAEVRHVHEYEEKKYHIGLQFEEVKGLPTPLLIDYLEEIFK